MSPRQRPTTSSNPEPPKSDAPDSSKPSSSFSKRALETTAHLANLLPTGTRIFDYPAASVSGVPDLSKYRLSCIDMVHAVVSVLVFFAVAFRDNNVLSCFYPAPAHETREVLDIVPIGVGFICSLVFVMFPTRRHGIGYPLTSDK